MVGNFSDERIDGDIPPANLLQMQDASRDAGGRWRPGHSGNPAGKPIGTRNMATMFAQALFDHDLEILVRQAIDRALKGDGVALKLCIDRILAPHRRERVMFEMPPLETAADGVRALAAIARATAEGELAPAEARDLSKTIDGFLRSIEAVDFERRLAALEAAPDLAKSAPTCP